MQPTSLQQRAVNRILELYHPEQKVVCEFKAPTGSGKTLMAGVFISDLILRHENENFVFVIATPSSSSLPQAFEQKLNRYKKDLSYPRFEPEYVQSPSVAQKEKCEGVPKILPQRNKVYLFGKASFGKGRILSEYGIIDDFVKTTVEQGYKLIYIRDEAHIGTEGIERGEQAQNFESLMFSHAAFVLKMTATPDFGNSFTQKVILREKDLCNETLNDGRWLLKTQAKPLINHHLEDSEVLSEAIKKFKQIKEDYRKLDVGIHPAMLIQVDNSSHTDPVRKTAFEDALGKIKQSLTAEGLPWVQYFGEGDKDSDRVYKKDFSLDEISDNRCEIDVIIFKTGPATGWDIPRACMLVQLRKVSSQKLNIQTIGRIKRNPYPGLERNPVTDNYYVLSDLEDRSTELKTYNYKVRDKFSTETFLKIEIANSKDLKDSKTAERRFKKMFEEYLDEHKNRIVQEINGSFVNGGTAYSKLLMLTQSGHRIVQNVSNPFIFLRDYKRLLAANNYLYKHTATTVGKFAKREKIQPEFVMTVLLEKHKRELRDLSGKTKNFTPRYEIRENIYDPKEYSEVYDGDTINEKVRRNYLFSINETDILNGNRQPLDSTPERFVFNRIYGFADEHDGGIRLWAKNHTSSNIYGDYMDYNNHLRKSYFDFIIKFDNGRFLYLEIKGKDDIEPEKTELLEKAYSAYFTNAYKGLFSPRLVIAVCRVNTQNGDVETTAFFDEQEFNSSVKHLPLEKLMKRIADMV